MRSGLAPGERAGERVFEARHDPLDRQLEELGAEALGEQPGVALRSLGAVARRHRDAVHPLGPQRLASDRRRQGRVDPSRNAQDDVREAVLPHVVAEPELEREPHLLEVVEQRSDRGLDPAARLVRGADVDDRARRAQPPARLPASAAERRAAAAPLPPPARCRPRAAPPRTPERVRAPRPRRRARPNAHRRRARPARRRRSRTRRSRRCRAHASGASARARAPCRRGTATRRCCTISCAPANARSVAGGPGCQMSSQTVGPMSASPCSSRKRSRPGAK